MLHERFSSDARPGLDPRLGFDKQYGLDAEPGLDLPPKLQVPVHSFAAYQDVEPSLQTINYKLVHLNATYALKLHVLQRYKATSKSHTLQTRLVHLFVTYALTLHVRIRFSRPINSIEKSRMSSSAIIDQLPRFWKLRRIFSAIWTSSTLWT